jgi:signal transduction histidine kinase/ActR/RegA family two-component response regulator
MRSSVPPLPSTARPGLVALIDRLARWRLGALADEEERRWARVVLLASLLFLAFGGVWSLSFLAYDQPWVAAGMAVGALLLPLVFLRVRSPKGLRLGVQVFLGTLLLTVSLANLATGGLSGANVATFVLIPLTALLLSARAAWLWGLMTAAIMAGFEAAHLLGYAFPSIVPAEYLGYDQAWTWGAVMAFVIGMSAFYERERLRAARELRQAMEQAERLGRARSEFLAQLSHEVRTPLHAMLGALEVAAQAPTQQAEARENLDLARDAALSLIRVIDDILDLARLEAGKLDLRPADFELRPALESVLRPLALLARKKGLDFDWQLDPDLPARLHGDAARLQQVLLNLVGNAIKFTARGSVRVTVELAAPTDERVPVSFRIEDTGVGIPADRQAAVFQPFEQASGPAPGSPAGSGLGLGIASRLVEQMGGRIELHSHEGLGTTLAFRLELEAARASAPVEPASGLRVLVAEDDRASLLITTRMLERLGHRVRGVDDGQAALAALEAEAFDLMLLDVQMPCLDGLETIRRQRARERSLATGRLPVIALTAHDMEEDRQRCLAAGMDGFLPKPIELAALRTEIARVSARPACA